MRIGRWIIILVILLLLHYTYVATEGDDFPLRFYNVTKNISEAFNNSTYVINESSNTTHMMNNLAMSIGECITDISGTGFLIGAEITKDVDLQDDFKEGIKQANAFSKVIFIILIIGLIVTILVKIFRPLVMIVLLIMEWKEIKKYRLKYKEYKKNKDEKTNKNKPKNLPKT